MHIRGVYGFSSLMKQNKKAKIYAVFCFAGKRKLFFYIYDVITWEIFYKRSTNHYSYLPVLGVLMMMMSFICSCRNKK
jgi:hypothetical protein